MLNLSRTEFPDLLWGQDDLDDVARLWFAWHDQARGENLRGLRSFQRVRLRLWGTARPDCDTVADKLEVALTAAGIDEEARLDDVGYLVVTGPWEPATDPCRLGRWLGGVNDAAFDGLVLLLELSIHDFADGPEAPAAAGGTVVMVGQLRREGFLLKAIWPVGLEPGLENLYRLTLWPYEGVFLHALESFRAGVATPAPENYFTGRTTQRWGTGLARLIIHLPGPKSVRKGRLSTFLFRSGFHASALTAVLLVQFFTPDWPAKALVTAALATAFIGLLTFVVVSEANRVWTFYWRMKAAMKRIYSRPVEHEVVTLAELGLDADPNARKYTREVKALGGQHMGDIRHVNATSGKTVMRVFVFPEERTYFFLMLMASAGSFQKFPAHAHFFILTRLTDGRVITINEGGGYRKSLMPETFQRRFPDIDDPETMLAKHRKFVAEICAEGNTLAPLDDLPALLEHQKEDHERIRPIMEKWGYYSWSAAFRQAFELVRKEYLEPAGCTNDGQEPRTK